MRPVLAARKPSMAAMGDTVKRDDAISRSGDMVKWVATASRADSGLEPLHL